MSSDVPGDEAAALSYAEAIAELEAIVRQIEGTDVDVDALTAQVERAAVLLKTCRRRIAGVETRIRDVLGEIEAEEEAEWSREPS